MPVTERVVDVACRSQRSIARRVVDSMVSDCDVVQVAGKRICCQSSVSNRAVIVIEAERTPAKEREIEDPVRPLEAAVRGSLSGEAIFRTLHEGLARSVGFKVLTVLKLDTATLRSVRLYSSEPSYPVGGVKQHGRNAWSEAVLDHRSVFVAHDLAELRATFPDSAAIEATGCGCVIAAPIVWNGGVVGTMNLWHRDGFYDRQMGERVLPFATAIAPLVAR